jgi:AcrR family transcriptional regulator
MSRLNRAEAQQRNRAKVLASARAEFTERGFRDAKVDAIAERAELTRGAVYSNFPGKRALYLAVLAEDAERVPALSGLEPGRTVRSG